MQICLEEAQRRKHDVIWLGVWEQNARAIAFYQKFGFVPVGKQIFQLGDDPQHDLVMQKVLG
jgi:diamine N-acetyltransferase